MSAARGAKGRCRDAEVLAALVLFRKRRGRMPTSAEACEAIGIMRGSLARILARLAAKGQLRALPPGTIAYALPVKRKRGVARDARRVDEALAYIWGSMPAPTSAPPSGPTVASGKASGNGGG